ncbi:heat shock protein 30 [Epithele typhae]|uniref:heat shock protein 30 n=1 Tax=Epithele typhae TaxID=378194 RepID=UPI002007B04C|nr:heat shock protein 30 [Epithele typhae]KAH9946064.1 heat shock protein 30 [Epithele typhae]
MGGNEAINNNPSNANFRLSTHGSDWLWTTFCIFTVSLLIMVAMAFRRPRGMRLFHQIAIVVLTTGMLAYFSMASNLGSTPVQTEFRGRGTRQIFFVRYINWLITFPLLLLELLLATPLSLSDIFTTIFMGIVLVIMGLVGALVTSSFKWGYFVFGVAALFYVWYILLWHAPRTGTFAAGGVLRRGYMTAAGYLSFLLLLYPIAWACAEGANVITVTSEMIWYGILDLFAGPMFLFLFLYELRDVDYQSFGLQSGKYTDKSAYNTRQADAPTGSHQNLSRTSTAPSPSTAPAPANGAERV